MKEEIGRTLYLEKSENNARKDVGLRFYTVRIARVFVYSVDVKSLSCRTIWSVNFVDEPQTQI
jgi:hypothetical protein